MNEPNTIVYFKCHGEPFVATSYTGNSIKGNKLVAEDIARMNIKNHLERMQNIPFPREITEIEVHQGGDVEHVEKFIITL